MSPSRPRRALKVRSVIPAVLVAVAIALLAPSLASAVNEPPPGGGDACTTVTFIGARGSGQSATGYDGVGSAIDRLAVDLKGALAVHHKSMTILPDGYPADSVSVLKPSKKELLLLAASPALGIYEYKKNYYDHFAASIEDGTAIALREARLMLDACPHTKIVFAGYSQGAMAIHQAELQALAAHRTRLIRHLAGTLLIGDGDLVSGTHAYRFGSASTSAEGIRTWAGGNNRLDVPFPSTTAEICTSGDLVCNFSLSLLPHASHAASVHSGYVRGSSARPGVDHAAAWLAGLIAG